MYKLEHQGSCIEDLIQGFNVVRDKSEKNHFSNVSFNPVSCYIGSLSVKKSKIILLQNSVCEVDFIQL